MEQIKNKLKQLRLSGALTSLESRNQYALEQGLSYLDFLDLVLEDERVVRANNAYKRRLKQSVYSGDVDPPVRRNLTPLEGLLVCR